MIEISHPDRIVFPEIGGTKAEVVEYYQRIGEVALPHLANRPLVVQRFPEGIDEPGFFQKNTPDHTPDRIRRVEMRTEDGRLTTYPVAAAAEDLAYFANQGTVSFHTLLARASAPERPVEVIFDLDPADADLGPVRAAARELRAVLEDLELAPRVKSSGSRGLHVIVDVSDEDADLDFERTRSFARAVAELIVDRGPFTLEHRIARRRGRLFLDVLRNAPANHAVAPYSLRARPRAPIAVPLDWDEALSARFSPQRITIRNIWRRLGQREDPWTLRARPSRTIEDALHELEDARAAEGRDA